MLIIPFADMDKDTLHILLEELVTRDGTDYGITEMSTGQKVDQVLRQLAIGSVCLCYDQETESCNILPAAEAKRLAE